MTPSLLSIVDRAITILETYGWTQGYYARAENGAITASCSSIAASFCVYGALCRATYDLSDQSTSDSDGLRRLISNLPEYETLEEITYTKLGYNNLVHWNDIPGRTKEEVINFLKEIRKELAQ